MAWYLFYNEKINVKLDQSVISIGSSMVDVINLRLGQRRASTDASLKTISFMKGRYPRKLFCVLNNTDCKNKFNFMRLTLKKKMNLKLAELKKKKK